MSSKYLQDAIGKLNDNINHFKVVKFARDLELGVPFAVEMLEEINSDADDNQRYKLMLHLARMENYDGESKEWLETNGKFKIFMTATFSSYEKIEALRYLIANRGKNRLFLTIVKIVQLTSSDCPVFNFEVEDEADAKTANQLAILNHKTNFLEIRSASALDEKKW